MGKGIGGHHKAFEGHNDEWLTPPEIVRELGPFDLDPCSPIVRPWDTAKKHFTKEDDGLSQSWFGKVWVNPPYGPHTGSWLHKLAKHGDGIALIFARTETAMFFECVWKLADSVLFLENRLHFYTVDGKRAKCNAGGPSVLIAYGTKCTEVLQRCSIKGYFTKLSCGHVNSSTNSSIL
jgi:hypothetical protein